MISTSPFHPGDKVVAYCRYSEGDEQGLKNQSTEEQADAIRRFCDQNDLILTRVFADPFASGRSVAKRDHYLEMLSYLLHKKKPDVQGVVLWDFERYGRNYDQAQLDAARLRMAGYKLFSLQQPITDDSPFAHVLEAMYFASAQNQSDMISADVKRALQSNFQKYKVIPRSCIRDGWRPVPVKMGVLSDGRDRIGYRAEPDKRFAALVRQAIQERMHGASLSHCRKIIGDSSNLNVKRLFASPLLYGEMTYGGTTIKDYCEPIIDRETFDALQIYERSHPGRQHGRQGGWSTESPMLSGLLFCAECGGPMYIYRRKSKGHLYRSYYCENSCFGGIKQDVLDPLIIDLVEAILRPENVRIWIDQLSDIEGRSAMEELRKDTEKELQTVQKRIDTTVTLLIDHPSEALTAKLSELESQRDTLRNTMKKVSQNDSAGFDAETLYNSTLELSKRILSVLRNPETSAENKKTALQTIVRSIVIARDGRIVVNYLPPGYGCRLSDQRPIKEPAENNQVVGCSRRDLSAPPVDDGFNLQLRYIWTPKT